MRPLPLSRKSVAEKLPGEVARLRSERGSVFGRRSRVSGSAERLRVGGRLEVLSGGCEDVSVEL